MHARGICNLAVGLLLGDNSGKHGRRPDVNCRWLRNPAAGQHHELVAPASKAGNLIPFGKLYPLIGGRRALNNERQPGQPEDRPDRPPQASSPHRSVNQLLHRLQNIPRCLNWLPVIGVGDPGTIPVGVCVTGRTQTLPRLARQARPTETKKAHQHGCRGAHLVISYGRESGASRQGAASLLLTVVKVALALVPRAVMATRQTTMMRASITAYSTAVGPSSLFRNLTSEALIRFSMSTPCGEIEEVGTRADVSNEDWAGSAPNRTL